MTSKRLFLIILVIILTGFSACDTTGIPETGSISLNLVDPENINAADPAPVIEGDHVIFRGNKASHNSKYYARLIQGEIWVSPNTMRTGETGPWEKLADLPDDLEGDIIEFAMDDEHIIALNSERQVYTMWKANKDISDFHWQKAWGFPFWFGPGLKLRDDLIKWDFTVVSIDEDEHWTDPAGNLIDIGAGKCSHITMLYEGGSTFSFNDPWLPLDYSYEIALPYRGRFIAENISSSGSTHFIINKKGDMYSRLFDFDISGLDALFMPCEYKDQTGLSNPKIQLPAEEWALQPKIDTAAELASITDRISITKYGKNCLNRILRVEGTNAYGNTGYYEKEMSDKDPNGWKFIRTDRVLEGTILDNTAADTSGETLVAGTEDRYYDYNIDKDIPDWVNAWSWRWIYNWEWKATLNNFNCYNSPAVLTIYVGGKSFDLNLHYRGTIRIIPRERGLDDNPRKFDAAIEIPPPLAASLTDSNDVTAQFLKDYFNNSRWTTVTIDATMDKLTIHGIASHARTILWTFKNGRWAE